MKKFKALFLLFAQRQYASLKMEADTMQTQHDLIEFLGKIREGKISIADQGFDSAFLAWLTTPKNLNKNLTTQLALLSPLKDKIKELAEISEKTNILDLWEQLEKNQNDEADFVRFITGQESRAFYPEAAVYIDKHRQEIFKLFKNIHSLKRTGWLNHNVKNPESVAEHTYSVTLMTFLLTPETMNKDKAVSMALLHDIQETLTGDYTPEDNITPQEKAQKELQSSKKISKSLENPQILKIFEEFEAQTSNESRWVKDVDHLDAVLLANYYDKHNRAPQLLLEEFASHAQKTYIGGYDFDFIKNIYNTLNNTCANSE